MTQDDLEQIKATIREMMTEFECPPCEEGVADDPAVLRTLPNQRAHPAGHAPPRRRGVQVLREVLPLSRIKTLARPARAGEGKFQSVNPPSLRSVGIPETPDRAAVLWIAAVPEDAWIEDDQVPGPSKAATGRRTPPVAAVPGIVEAAIVVAAAARKGRKPKVVRAVAFIIPSAFCFELRADAQLTRAPVSCQRHIRSRHAQKHLQVLPVLVTRDTPAARTQGPSHHPPHTSCTTDRI